MSIYILSGISALIKKDKFNSSLWPLASPGASWIMDDGGGTNGKMGKKFKGNLGQIK